METKRFIGNDLARLYERVRREFGPDAVIVRTRSLMREGAEPLIELTAAPPEPGAEMALDLQWTMVDGALGRLQIARPRATVGDIEDAIAREALPPPRLVSPEPAEVAPFNPGEPHATGESAPWLQEAVAGPPPGATVTRRRQRPPLAALDEMADTVPPPAEWARRPRPASPTLRRTVADEPARPAPVDLGPRIGGDRLARELIAAGMTEAAAHAISQRTPAGADPFFALVRTLQSFESAFPGHEETAVISIAGPAGSGRTTALIRMAMDCADSGRPVVLVAADSTRAAARQQIHAYGDATGLAVRDGMSDDALEDAVASAPPGACLFVDFPAGAAQPSPALAATCYTYAALPATWQARALERFLEANPGAFAGCIPTFVDLAPDLSPVLSTAITAGLPITFLSSGRDIAQGLDVADFSMLASGILRGTSRETTDGRLVASA